MATAPSHPASGQRLQRMEQAVRVLIQGLGEDLEREGLRDTPKVSLMAADPREHAGHSQLTCSPPVPSPCAARGQGAARLHRGVQPANGQVKIDSRRGADSTVSARTHGRPPLAAEQVTKQLS